MALSPDRRAPSPIATVGFVTACEKVRAMPAASVGLPAEARSRHSPRR